MNTLLAEPTPHTASKAALKMETESSPGSLLGVNNITTLCQLWDNTYRQSVPEQVALTAYNGTVHSLTYKEINARTHCLAAYMLSKGLQRADRVLILGENQSVFLCLDLAIHFAGGVSVALSKRFSPAQVQAVVQATTPKFVLVTEYGTYHRLKQILATFAEQLEVICANDKQDEPQEGDQFTTLQSAVDIGKVFWRENTQLVKETKEAVQPHHPAAIVYDPHTRRKAGEPVRGRTLAGIVLSHANFIAALNIGAAHAHGFTRRQRVLSFLTPTSAYQRLAGYYLPVVLGMPLLLANSMEQAAALLVTEKPAALIAAPAFLRYLFGQVRRQFMHSNWLRGRWFDRAVRVAARMHQAAEQNKKPSLWISFQHNLFGKIVFQNIRQSQLSSLQAVFGSGHQLPVALANFYRQAQLPLVTGFGVNECSGLITLPLPNVPVPLGSTGTVVTGGRVKIQRGVIEHIVNANDASAETPMGILYVGGDTLMLGTWQNNALKPAQAWYETAFTGYFKEGQLYLQEKR